MFDTLLRVPSLRSFKLLLDIRQIEERGSAIASRSRHVGPPCVCARRRLVSDERVDVL
jgi:hypothetical protein